jgi:tetratricopeptide (TPR) repeat protein
METTAAAAELQRAWALHQQQRYDEAEAIYRNTLAASPRHAVALFLLGRLELDQGRHELAAEHLAAAVQSDASKAVYYATLARAEGELGRINRAAGNYRLAIDLEPDSADYHVNLGNVLLLRKEATEAIACYKRAIELDPQLAEARTSLGAVLEHQGQLDEAVACHRQAIALRPTYAEALHNLGNALVKLNHLDEALECFRRATELKPDWDAPWANLGALYHSFGDDAEAARCMERALALTPRFADHHVSQATLMRDQGRLPEALDSYERALALDPRNAGAWYGRALVNLSLGRFSEGWAGLEHRVECHPSRTLSLPEPRWDGAPLGGRTLLVHAEWTLADTIQFVRLARLIEGGRVVLAVQPELVEILVASGFPHVVSFDELPKFDVHLPLLSLPRVLQIELSTIPADVPYLDIDPPRVARWRDALAAYQGFRVGVAWQEDARRPLDRARAIPPLQLKPLADVNGVDLISLQAEPAGEPPLGEALPCRINFLDNLVVGPAAIPDIAAVMKNLDLVIVCDSYLAHLAGALGVPVWVALPKPAGWRWLVDREDSPWYPTMRLIRQMQAGDWSSVIAQVASRLRERVASNNLAK